MDKSIVFFENADQAIDCIKIAEANEFKINVDRTTFIRGLKNLSHLGSILVLDRQEMTIDKSIPPDWNKAPVFDWTAEKYEVVEWITK